MPLICVICIEKLTENSDFVIDLSEKRSNDDRDIIVSTLCGHLFHKSCLIRGLKSTKSRLKEIGSKNVLKGDVCPTCSTPINVNKLVRLFPSEEDDHDSTRVARENQELKNQLDKLAKENLLLQNKLKSEAASHTVAAQSENNEIGGFKLGDRVVWLRRGASTASGAVRCLTKIDDVTFAEVNFDFRNNHCRIPLKELMLHSDFCRTDTSSEDTAIIKMIIILLIMIIIIIVII